jgi:magnesium chelatase subunit I
MEYKKLKTQEKVKILTLGELKATGYENLSVRDELRVNLLKKLRSHEQVFPGIFGYEETVIPELQRAILAKHSLNLLGLRGQAKTRIARLLINLLDEVMPVLEGSELNEDPLNPLTKASRDFIMEHGDKTPVAWVSKGDRYTEKLATPDVTVADLIGDVDPIKAASLKLPYSDERVIHYGLVPRSHRGIFVINELPDLQARIQVALFNILQEGDIQIRGFRVRLPLDIQFVFTANPEDYTNRGSIVTPLKDRIDSQIITHYPESVEVSKKITRSEANYETEVRKRIHVPEFAADLIEQVAFEARKSEYIDEKSGVSARLTISAFENLLASAERRMEIHGEAKTTIRMGDFLGVIPSITGKVELVYEGEQEGAAHVAYSLIGKAIRTLFTKSFPDPENFRKKKEVGLPNPYQSVVAWFEDGKELLLRSDLEEKIYRKDLELIPGLPELIKRYCKGILESERFFFMEFALHGLAEFSLISKEHSSRGLKFKDLLSGMLSAASERDKPGISDGDGLEEPEE